MGYQTMKRNGGPLCAYLLSERSQFEKATYYMIPATQHSGKGQTMEREKKKIRIGGTDEEAKHKGFLGN